MVVLNENGQNFLIKGQNFLYFCPKISINHILFWANLGFLAIGFICENYTKKLFFYYKNKHSKIFEILAMVNKALNNEDTQES